MTDRTPDENDQSSREPYPHQGQGRSRRGGGFDGRKGGACRRVTCGGAGTAGLYVGHDGRRRGRGQDRPLKAWREERHQRYGEYSQKRGHPYEMPKLGRTMAQQMGKKKD